MRVIIAVAIGMFLAGTASAQSPYGAPSPSIGYPPMTTITPTPSPTFDPTPRNPQPSSRQQIYPSPNTLDTPPRTTICQRSGQTTICY